MSDTKETGSKDTKETARLWSDSIKSQLAQIAAALVKDDAAGVTGKAPAVLANRIEMVDPDLLQTQEVYHGQSVKVVEVSPPAGLAPRPNPKVCPQMTLPAMALVS